MVLYYYKLSQKAKRKSIVFYKYDHVTQNTGFITKNEITWTRCKYKTII